MKEFFLNVDFEKILQKTKQEKLPSMHLFKSSSLIITIVTSTLNYLPVLSVHYL